MNALKPWSWNPDPGPGFHAGFTAAMSRDGTTGITAPAAARSGMKTSGRQEKLVLDTEEKQVRATVEVLQQLIRNLETIGWPKQPFIIVTDPKGGGLQFYLCLWRAKTDERDTEKLELKDLPPKTKMGPVV